MHKSGAHWKDERHSILYKWQGVVRKIGPPIDADARGQFRFEELI